MKDKIQIEEFSDKYCLEELIQSPKNMVSHLVFFSGASGNLKVNHREIPLRKFSVANFPIFSAVQFHDVEEKSGGCCISFSKEARDIFLTSSYQLFCPVTGVVNVNLNEILFGKLLGYLHEIHSEISIINPSSSNIIYLLTALVVQYISRSIDNNSIKQIQDEILLSFADLVDSEYKNNHGIKFYCDNIGVSTKTLSRLTRSILRVTPKQIIQYRINAEAIRLLIHSNQSIKEIAYELNFSSPDYFNYFFKKINNVSPSVFKINMSGVN